MVETAAASAAVLLVGVAVFQAALAGGAPLGAMAWGGTREGRLPTPMRLGSAAAVIVLIFAALVVLAQAGVLSWSPVPSGALGAVTWVIAGFMVLNTLGNVASKSRAERLVFGPITAVLAVLCIIVAAGGNGPG